MSETNPFSISKQWVMEAYLKVKSNKGSGGVDRISLKKFGEQYKKYLYNLWNQMSSGSHIPPPVRLKEIAKKDGGVGPLCLPTVADRISQTVGKELLEPVLEHLFNEDSYGYRPGKSAVDPSCCLMERRIYF
ncbi:MAG: hypothetical protein WKF89_06295 [Chitinophagaceae bacterium]